MNRNRTPEPIAIEDPGVNAAENANAPRYEVPSRDLGAVEFPAIIHDVDRALRAFGRVPSLSHVSVIGWPEHHDEPRNKLNIYIADAGPLAELHSTILEPRKPLLQTRQVA